MNAPPGGVPATLRDDFMAEAKGKKVSKLPKARKGRGKPSEPKLKKKTVRTLNEAYNRRKIRKRHPEGWEPVVT